MTSTRESTTMTRVDALAQFDVRANPADAALLDRLGEAAGVALPIEPNTAVSSPDGSRHALWLGPDEWLVMAQCAPDPLESSLRGAIREARGAVVDVSANRVMLRLAGPRARDVLAAGCSIDLHPRAFAPGHCAQTLLARANVLLLIVAAEPALDIRILVRPSFEGYLMGWMLDALAD